MATSANPSKKRKVLQPNESIANALRRVGNRGGEKLSAAEERKRRWAAKKAGGAVQQAESDAQVESLTALVDKLVSNGEFEAYQFTYEKIKVLLAASQEETAKRIVAVDKNLDMFGDPIDIDETKAPGEPTPSSSSATASADSKAESLDPLSTSVQWEYKWSMDEGADVVGPVSTEKMIDYQESDFFKAGAWARKFGASDAPFYSTKRIDFDLYT
uniref:GYF domain-containing protein n=1 Tax=Plectus sambesii TaxID=2011161 RepID=A0A914UVM3_9BILA